MSFEIDADDEISSVGIVYFTPEIPPCTIVKQVDVREIDHACDIEMSTDWVESHAILESIITSFEFTSCSISFVDECPLDGNGECIDGPSIDQVTISGLFTSEMVRHPCR